MSARILATPPVRFRRPLSLTQHRRCSCLVVCSICVGVYCRARLGVVFLRGSYAGLTIFSSVCISWYGRQLITIISDLVPSKKQISRIGAFSLIGGRQQQLSVWVCAVSFLNFFNDSLS